MAVVAQDAAPRFTCEIAATAQAVRESQKLRYRIFAEEMGAKIDGGADGVDQDRFDEHCLHLLVRSEEGEVVSCTRLLTNEGAAAAGEFYSEHEFEMDAIRQLDGRKLEVGRTCVAPEYRNGTTIAVLWSGLADFVADNRIDYMFGCASIPLADREDAERMIESIEQRYLSAPDLRVTPRQPLPRIAVEAARVRMPPLLKAYVALGARACGAPYWDTDFGCADVFMLLNIRELHPRYARRFLGERLGQPRA